MNSLGIDLTGKDVLIKEEVMLPEFSDVRWRRFHVDGGFGASAAKIGGALIGMFVEDGERARMEGSMVECLWADNFLVVDTKDIAAGQAVPMLGLFPTEEAASEFIATLPEADTGRYGIDLTEGS